MRPFRFITFVLGILIIIMGAYCLFHPTMTYMSFGYFIGINMIVDSIVGIMLWVERKRFFAVSVWALIGWILSLLFGIFLICSTAMQLIVDMTIVYVAAAWLAALGILRIIISIRINIVRKELDTYLLGRRWWLVLIGGILLVICGVFSFFDPSYLIKFLGIYLGISIIVTGADMVAIAM